MVRFIDDHRAEYGVEPICKVLPIAPSTYYTHKACEANPDLRSARVQRDEQLCVEIQRVWYENYQVYGVRKVWRQLCRERIFAGQVHHCPVNEKNGSTWCCSRPPDKNDGPGR